MRYACAGKAGYIYCLPACLPASCHGLHGVHVCVCTGCAGAKPVYAAILTPKGKFLHDVFIYRHPCESLHPAGAHRPRAPGRAFLPYVCAVAGERCVVASVLVGDATSSPPLAPSPIDLLGAGTSPPPPTAPPRPLRAHPTRPFLSPPGPNPTRRARHQQSKAPSCWTSTPGAWALPCSCSTGE